MTLSSAWDTTEDQVLPATATEPLAAIAAVRHLDPYDDLVIPLEEAPGRTGEATGCAVSTWTPAALSAVLSGLADGTLGRPSPTLGRFDGLAGGLFYPGRVNGLAGESGSGKTWTALVVVAQELADERAVVYVDLEDDAAGIVGRLLDLGVDPGAIGARFAYVSPNERLDIPGAEALARTIEQLQPTVVVIDSTGEALALDGAKPNDDDQVALWFRRLPRAIADRGPAVLLLDHTTKVDVDGLWPIGSQRKRAAITGAQFMQRTVRPFDKWTPGHAKLVCAKDRNGNYRPGQHVVDLKVTPTGGRVVLELVAASDGPRAEGGGFRPTGYMERISLALEALGEPVSFNGVCERITGKRAHIRAAVDALVVEGYLTTTPGPRGATLHSVAKTFRETSAGEPVAARSESLTGSTGSGSLGGEPGTSGLTGSGNRSGTGGEPVKCAKCSLALDPWLVDQGQTEHVGCGVES